MLTDSCRTDSEIDQLYLKSLEDRLRRLKDPNSALNNKGSKFLSDLSSAKDHHLFHLLTTPASKNDNSSQFEDNFTEQSIEAHWVQRKIAPQTCAINTEEKKRLLKHDELESQIRQQLNDQILQVITQELEEEKRESEEDTQQEIAEQSKPQFEKIEVEEAIDIQTTEWTQFNNKDS
ncbi:hypothetical protein M3Y97_00142100 [Aphelenchoides bicaudatus]|nr:hypothetical protein M3Y97_00142100 [Aphelenchoides bicaudatus]